MNNFTKSAALLLLAGVTAHAQTIIADNYNANSGTTRGFLLGEGVNFNINPPATRLTGSAAADLRYIATDATKLATNYRITGGKAQIAASANNGRFTLSYDGTTAFDFGSALGIATATAANPVVYDVTISMASSQSGTARFSFALGTAENNANFWDFGVQLYRAVGTDTFYQIGKRIDVASWSTGTSSGATGDVNAPIMPTDVGTYGTELVFRMHVTDAGAESGTDYNSRLELFLNDTMIYDTASDSALNNHWRLDGAGRYFMWDQAGNNGGTGAVTYDNFSVTLVPEPSTLTLGLLAGVVGLIWRRR
jgi:hypothetical protein